MISKKRELEASELRCVCDSKMFPFKTTREVAPLTEVIGQKRAVKAIEFGLNMDSAGYNIFVTGIEGTGKTTIVGDLVRRHAKKIDRSPDWCMVNNFEDEFRPRPISLPPGKAYPFSRALHQAITHLKKEIPEAFESEAYQDRLAGLKKQYTEKQQRIFRKAETMARKHQIIIRQTKAGFEAVPVIDQAPISREKMHQLPPEQQKTILSDLERVQQEIETNVRKINKIHQSLLTRIEKLMDEVTLSLVIYRLDTVRREYAESVEVSAYLDAIQQNIIDNVSDFIPTKNSAPHMSDLFSDARPNPLERYRVNVLVDRKSEKGAPVIFESNPTFQNLFGRIEKRAYLGTLATDFSMVQAGSLLQANGGYLIMEVESLLMMPYVWEALKRALQNKSLSIEDVPAEAGFGASSLRPEPIPLDVKVILLGDYGIFQMLQEEDSRFNKIFKVRADFDNVVERTEENIHMYARFIARACKEEGLLPFTPTGVAAIVEHGERLIGDQTKLSVRFGPIMAVLKEADYWARKSRARLISDKYVRRAVHERRFRYNLYEEKMHENFIDGTFLVDVDGEEVGQVNALAVYQVGDASFGRPSRITAETWMGGKGVINIEREAKLSGSSHDKGVLILSGYLGRTFAQQLPLSLSISITFEQSYGEVDGDSASSTELYAILSSLADMPIHQGIAVTGSVNQKGMIQPIGGANQKVEGFYDVCKSRGLTGRQGVLIPETNVKNLMLKRDVIQAVRSNRFHIYPVKTIEEGIEILTGMPAGTPDVQGRYPDHTVFGKVQRKLQAYFERSIRIRGKLDGDGRNVVV